MKLKYKVLRDAGFNAAVRKLANYPFRVQKTAYDVKRITDKLSQEEKVAQDLFIKLLKQHAKLDDKGNFIPRMEGDPPAAVPDTYVIDDAPEKLAAFGKAQEEFADLEFNLDWRQIAFEKLEECRLTAAEIAALDNLLAEPVEDEAAEVKK